MTWQNVIYQSRQADRARASEPGPRGENAFNNRAKIEAARLLVLGKVVLPRDERVEYRKDYSSNGSIIRVEGEA